MVLFNLRDLQIHGSTETAFGVAESHTAFAATKRSVRCTNQPTLTIAQAALDNPALRQRLAKQLGPILGLKNATKIAFAAALRGTGTPANSGVFAKGAVDQADGQLLKSAFGGESLGKGSPIASGPTTTGFTVTTPANLAEGQAILVLVGDGYEASVIGDITGSAVTLTRALSAAPAVGAIVHGSATYYPLETLGSTLQFQCVGAESTDGYFRVLGCQADCKFSNLAPGQLPQVDYDILCASWVKYLAATLADATYTPTVNAPVPGYASQLFIATSGTTTRTPVHCSALTIEPGLAVEGMPSVSGIQGLQGYARSGIAPTVDMTIFPWADDWHDKFVAGTTVKLHYQIGSTPGSTVLIEVQKLVLSEVPNRAAVGQQCGVHVKGIGLEDTTIGTGELARAAIRVHLL